jgi:hypothetical protein
MSPTIASQPAIFFKSKPGLAARRATVKLRSAPDRPRTHPSAEPLAAGASIVLFLDMILFGWIVVRRNDAAFIAARPAKSVV